MTTEIIESREETSHVIIMGDFIGDVGTLGGPRRIVSSSRKSQVKGVSAIKKPDKTVVHELKDILKVWATHFASIKGTPNSQIILMNNILDWSVNL